MERGKWGNVRKSFPLSAVVVFNVKRQNRGRERASSLFQ